MMSILEAIELLPIAAALVECPSLKIVAQNALSADDQRRLLGSDGSSLDEVLAEHGLPDAMRETCGSDAVASLDTPWGWVSVSRMLGGPEMARPDLVLVTYAGSGRTRTFATLQHQRAAALLVVHEHAHRTARMLEDALLQVQAALVAQQMLVKQANQASERLTATLADTPNLNGS